ncbi:MAG: murein biosynthesis integral membrane protein MurJ [Gemmatimonadales bacterium]|jgi:putative peptidoglycan lipid II flippase
MAGSQGRSAATVAGGILLTRILGFVRERVFAHYFGDGAAADAWRAALRIPNVIRNLLGEGTLSASFIPVYAGMIERGERENARVLSGTIASFLVLLTAVATLVGLVLAPVITDFVAPGFAGPKRDLTVTLVQVMFPMAGVMILSAWCLGVLNTHRKFFLAYAAPSLWNIAQIATLIALGGVLIEAPLIVALAVGALVGSVLQLIVQLPTTLRIAGGFAWSLRLGSPGVRTVLRGWIPVVIGAGAYQVSSIIDTQLASLLGTGPVSLFGVSVAAVALPEMSREAATNTPSAIKTKLATGSRRVGYFSLPAAVAFAALSTEIIGGLFQTGAFGSTQTEIAGAVLAAYAIGVPAQSLIKLFASGHYALGDTKTPVRIALFQVAVAAVAAYLLMQRLGPVGIALGAAIGGYVNITLNYAMLTRRVGRILSSREQRALALSIAATVPAAFVGMALADLVSAPLWASAGVGLAGFGLVYGVLTIAFGHPDARELAVRGFRR